MSTGIAQLMGIPLASYQVPARLCRVPRQMPYRVHAPVSPAVAMQWNVAPEVPTRATTVRPNALRDASRPDGPTLTMKADATAGTRHDGHASFAELRHGEG